MLPLQNTNNSYNIVFDVINCLFSCDMKQVLSWGPHMYMAPAYKICCSPGLPGACHLCTPLLNACTHGQTTKQLFWPTESLAKKCRVTSEEVTGAKWNQQWIFGQRVPSDERRGHWG